MRSDGRLCPWCTNPCPHGGPVMSLVTPAIPCAFSAVHSVGMTYDYRSASPAKFSTRALLHYTNNTRLPVPGMCNAVASDDPAYVHWRHPAVVVVSVTTAAVSTAASEAAARRCVNIAYAVLDASLQRRAWTACTVHVRRLRSLLYCSSRSYHSTDRPTVSCSVE